MSHYHNPSAATQNQGNSLGSRSCVRQSELYRRYESGDSLKGILGTTNLCWGNSAIPSASLRCSDNDSVKSSNLTATRKNETHVSVNRGGSFEPKPRNLILPALDILNTCRYDEKEERMSISRDHDSQLPATSSIARNSRNMSESSSLPALPAISRQDNSNLQNRSQERNDSNSNLSKYRNRKDLESQIEAPSGCRNDNTVQPVERYSILYDRDGNQLRKNVTMPGSASTSALTPLESGHTYKLSLSSTERPPKIPRKLAPLGDLDVVAHANVNVNAHDTFPSPAASKSKAKALKPLQSAFVNPGPSDNGSIRGAPIRAQYGGYDERHASNQQPPSLNPAIKAHGLSTGAGVNDRTRSTRPW